MKKLILLISLNFILVIGFAQTVLFDQTAGVTNNGLVSMDMSEAFYSTYDTRIADDFQIPNGATWYIDSIKAYGLYDGGSPNVPGAGVNIEIFEDNNGAPGNSIYADIITQEMDPNGDGTINAPLDSTIVLTEGTYWVAFAAYKSYFSGSGTTWYWRLDSSNTLNEALWENPGGGYAAGCTAWTPLTDTSCVGVAYGNVSFRVYGCFGAEKPTVEPLEDTTFCEGPSVTLTAVGTGSNLAYIWNTGATTSSITTDSAGYYAVTVYNSFSQCGAKAEANMNILPKPKFDMVDDTICPKLLPFTIYANPANASVEWYNGNTGIVDTVTQGGVYWATYYGTNGCVGSDTMNLSVKPLDPPVFTPFTPIDLCEGESIKVSTVRDYWTYKWVELDENQDTIDVVGAGANPSFVKGGTYALAVTTFRGCQSKATFTIVDRPLPVPFIQQSIKIDGNTRMKTSSNYSSYAWSNGDSSAVITVKKDGEYSVTVTDEYGCEGTSSVDAVIGIEDDKQVVMSFYPNPTTGIVNYTWPSALQNEAYLEVYDNSGRLIESADSQQDKGYIDLSDFENGLYIIKIYNGEHIQRTPVIKQ